MPIASEVGELVFQAIFSIPGCKAFRVSHMAITVRGCAAGEQSDQTPMSFSICLRSFEVDLGQLITYSCCPHGLVCLY